MSGIGGLIALGVNVAAPTVAAACQEAATAEVNLAGESSQWDDELILIGFGGSLTHVEVDVAAPTVAAVCQEATAAEINLAGDSSQ